MSVKCSVSTVPKIFLSRPSLGLNTVVVASTETRLTRHGRRDMKGSNLLYSGSTSQLRGSNIHLSPGPLVRFAENRRKKSEQPSPRT